MFYFTLVLGGLNFFGFSKMLKTFTQGLSLSGWSCVHVKISKTVLNKNCLAKHTNTNIRYKLHFMFVKIKVLEGVDFPPILRHFLLGSQQFFLKWKKKPSKSDINYGRTGYDMSVFSTRVNITRARKQLENRRLNV